MKTTKKLTAVLLALLMLLSVFALAASALGSAPQADATTTEPDDLTGYDPASGESETTYVLRQLKNFIQNIRDTIRSFMQKLLPDFLSDLLFPPAEEDAAAKA